MPSLAGASTQPSLQFKDPKELLASASDAYQSVLNTYADQKHAAVAARFGLAAIAENRGDFDAAKKQYEAISQMTSDIAAYQQMANLRLKMVDDLRKPVIMANAATEPADLPPEVPTTQAIPPLVAAPGPATTATTRIATTQAAAAGAAAAATTTTTRSATP
jgi:hypothetical protein